MWIKQLVGITIIISSLVMGYIIIKGVVLVGPSNTTGTGVPAVVVTQGVPGTPPVITLSVDPSVAIIGRYSVINWSVSGDNPRCAASDDWQGEKTLVGTMSTGRLNTAKQYTYTLKCTSKSGTSKKSASVTVAEEANQ